MRKFTFSKTTSWGETFTAVEFDSFDEAIKAVEKGVSDRALDVGPKAAGLLGAAPTQSMLPNPPQSVVPPEAVQIKNNPKSK